MRDAVVVAEDVLLPDTDGVGVNEGVPVTAGVAVTGVIDGDDVAVDAALPDDDGVDVDTAVLDTAADCVATALPVLVTD